MDPAFTLTVELVAAARMCTPSLHKSLALPRLFSLCAELGGSLAGLTWKPGRYTRFAVQEPNARPFIRPFEPLAADVKSAGTASVMHTPQAVTGGSSRPGPMRSR